MRNCVLLICLLSVGFMQSKAQSTQKKELKLTSGTFEIPSVPDGEFENEYSTWPTFDGWRIGVVALEAFLSEKERNTLALNGIEILAFLPPAHYLVGIQNNIDQSFLESLKVTHATGYQPAFKGELNWAEAPEYAKSGSNSYLVNVHPFSMLDLNKVGNHLTSTGIKIVEKSPLYKYITVEIDAETFALILSHPAIQAVDWNYAPGEPENYTGRTMHRVNYIGQGNDNAIGYTGEGVNVMLQDDGEIGPHIDMHGRKTQFLTTNIGDHGDHVGGIIAGAGNLNPLYQGQAPGANLFVYRAAPLYQGYDSLANHYATKDVVITSTSYSDGCNVGYTARARLMDEQSFDLPKLMHVFSAGNSGTSNCGYGAGSTWGNVTGGHKMGKNVITVANLNSVDGVSNSSSRGPAYDGRIKPDISAKGTSVMSTLEDNQYGPKTGTSMSCPGVSGTLAVLYEAFEDITGQEPNGGLLKAIVLNTADDLGNKGPDFIHGWGRINARKAHDLIAANNYGQGLISQNESTTQAVSIPSGTANARFMLYWTDPAAAVNAATSLINDLDFKVIAPNGDTLLPYVLNHAPNASTLDDPAIAGEDHLNNMEQVEIDSPAAGVYTLLVNGTQVPFGPQEYHLVYWVEEGGLTLTYPVGGEKVFPDNNDLIRWDAAGLTGSLSVDFSDNAGMSWNTMVASVPAEQGYVYWSTPIMASANVMIRLVHGTDTVTSGTFSIMPAPTNLQVDWVCPDSLGLSWSAVINASGYDVYKLGDKYMDSIGSSSTTTFVDYNINPFSEEVWYSASAFGFDGAKSNRAIAIKKQSGIFNCPLQKDLEITTILPHISKFFGCHGLDKQLGMVVQNNGTGPVMGFNALLHRADSLIVDEGFSGNILPGGADTFYFTEAVELAVGTIPIRVSLSFTGDQNNWNDTLERVFTTTDDNVVNHIMEENFDLYILCSSDPDCGQTTCELGSGWFNETNGEGDDIDWRVKLGQTSTSLTGPSGDYTLNGFGRYVYLEADNCGFQTASLISPCIDLSNTVEPLLSFWYHMYGSQMGSLHVDVYDGQSWDLDIIEPIEGNQGDEWKQMEVDLSAYNDETINIRLRGVTGFAARSDMAIDGIMISHPPLALFEYAIQADQKTVVFTDKSAFGDDMTFNLDDGTILDSVPSEHVYDPSLVYTVTQIVTNELGSDSHVEVIDILSVEDSETPKASIYPNPADDQVLIVWGDREVDQIVILDLGGRTLKNIPVVEGQSYRLQTADLASGIYVVKVIGDRIEQHELIVR